MSQRVGQVAFAVACRMLEEHAGSREPQQMQAPGKLGVLLWAGDLTCAPEPVRALCTKEGSGS